MTPTERQQMRLEGKQTEAEADLRAKDQKVADLREATYAAAFALEQVKNEPDGYGLRDHWRDQEHAFILAEEETYKAKMVVNSYHHAEAAEACPGQSGVDQGVQVKAC